MPENSSRTAPCIGCGTQIPYRTNARVCCNECALARKRARARATAESIRRKNGVAPVKGLPHTCVACGAEFVRNTVRQCRCSSCQSDFAGARSRRYSQETATNPVRRETKNAWTRKRLRESPEWRISAHMSTLMHRALRSNKAGRSWREFVDYTLADLKAHLERQFLPGMTWKNHGEWHIDHIIPRASFVFAGPDDDNFKRCWALPNLRPIWAQDNVRKNATRTHLL